MESGEMCVFSIVKSTNFAKTLENAAEISDIQNWEEKKKRDVPGNEKKLRLKERNQEKCVFFLL
jgi:hypothetical protein